MISIFDTDIVTFEKPKYTLEVRNDGFTYTHKKKGALNVNFDDLLTIIVTNYFSSNGSYMLTLVSVDSNQKNLDITLDEDYNYEHHNIKETKTLLIAFAAHKLTKEFPNNIGELDLTLGVSLKEKQIKLRGNKIIGAKHEVDINQIKRVVCAVSAIGYFGIYTSETKKGLFDKPDMVVPINSVTAPLLESIVTKNTGKGIDFSRGNNWDQKTSEFIIIRFMEPGFFLTDRDSIKEEWQKIAFDRVVQYGYFINGDM
ncbi:hypothetical protein [Mogibacterium pumilum]|uniref:Uncharacterized protein n=1 Tax=Mogibacterium pumilum TaxID=86332 RepID=A0A223ATE4_9FIRM|nr:hypothetical protein [Mogibacterium pumilum]ASS38243.1 hypothetical protein AXF17_07400 [Mogibacterium pumilum]